MRTTFLIRRHLLAIWVLATSWLFLLFPAHSGATEDNKSEQLISTLLADNERWLQPSVSVLSYTFRMKHTKRDDLYEIEICYETPGHLTVVKDGKITDREIDNEYDPNNSATSARLLTILQGVTFFGPMQELSLAPKEHRLAEIDDEAGGGWEARVLQLIPTGEPSESALLRWEEKVENCSRTPRYWYVLTPAEQEHQGETRAIIRAECLFEEGPGWNRIQESLSKDPTRVIWAPSAEASRQRAEVFRAFLLPGKNGIVPFLIKEGQESAEMLPRVLVTEGDKVPNEALHESLKDILPKPERLLSMRIGCGLWGLWYGYMGRGATEDRIWVDRSTGAVLREEGYQDGDLCFRVEYGDFEQLPDGKNVPRHVLVRLVSGETPWTFDMRFSTHGGKIWLLDRLIEYQGEDKVAEAWISDVEVE